MCLWRGGPPSLVSKEYCHHVGRIQGEDFLGSPVKDHVGNDGNQGVAKGLDKQRQAQARQVGSQDRAMRQCVPGSLRSSEGDSLLNPRLPTAHRPFVPWREVWCSEKKFPCFELLCHQLRGSFSNGLSTKHVQLKLISLRNNFNSK